ncbi:MAG TPA: NADPH-dependent F420 reductase [Acidimicrobiia bacterium]
MTIGVLGGTGPAGKGIAARLASVGHHVVIGSRDSKRAEAAAGELRTRWGNRVGTLAAGQNADAAAAELVVIATKWDAAVPTAAAHADQLSGKVVISMANGLVKHGREFRPALPPEGSLAAAVKAAAAGAHIVAAFHLVPADALEDLDRSLSSDVLVAGDDEGRVTVLDLVDGIPDLRALDAGSLVNAVGIEAFSAALLTVNLRHHGEATLHLAGIGPRRSPSDPARGDR